MTIQSFDKNIFNFDALRLATGLEIKSLGLTCPKCGNVWGIRLFEDQHSIADIHPKRLKCNICEEARLLEENNQEYNKEDTHE